MRTAGSGPATGGGGATEDGGAGAPDRLLVATANIQHGMPAHGSGERRPSAALLARAFAGVHVDLLALQEVDVGQPRSAGVDQAALVARATGLRYYRFAAAVAGDVRTGRSRAPVASVTSPAYGVTLLSRYPVLAWFAQPLPGPVRLPVADEPRVALAGVVRTPGGLLCVAAVHLSRGPVARRQLAQVRRRLLALAGRVGEPAGHDATSGRGLGRRRRSVRPSASALILGDLNVPPDVAQRAGTPLADVATHPAHAPARQPDHVLGLGGVVADGPATTDRLAVSDHRLLAVPVRLVPATPVRLVPATPLRPVPWAPL